MDVFWEVPALFNSPMLVMAILAVMAIAVVVVIAMTLKLNQDVRNLAEDVEIDRRNLAKLNHEVGRRLGSGHGAVAGAKFSELFFASCKDEELAAYVKTLL